MYVHCNGTLGENLTIKAMILCMPVVLYVLTFILSPKVDLFFFPTLQERIVKVLSDLILKHDKGSHKSGKFGKAGCTHATIIEK